MIYHFLYRSYAWFYTQAQWRRTRLTRAGRAMAWAAVITGIAGINIFRSAIYQILMLSLAYILVALVLTWFARVRVKVARVLPDYAMAGKALTYMLELVNQGAQTEKGLVLYEILQDPRPSVSELLSRPEPGEETRNWWDRKVLYYRWLWLVRENEKAGFAPVPLPDLPPLTTVRVRVTITPHTRGRLNLAAVALARPDPLGLFNALTRIPLKGRVMVVPRIFDLDPPDPEGGRKHHAGGVWLASSVGNADEFCSLRDYRPGDSLRHIHWKTYARTRTLAVREFEDEYFVRHALVLDTDLPGQGAGQAVFESAVSVAASLAQGMRLAEAILDLIFVGSQVYSFSRGRGMAGAGQLLEVLACVRPAPAQEFSALAAHMAENLDRLSGSTLIFLDWDLAREGLAARIHRAGIPVRVILVCAKDARQKMDEKIRNSRALLPKVCVMTAGREIAGQS